MVEFWRLAICPERFGMAALRVTFLGYLGVKIHSQRAYR